MMDFIFFITNVWFYAYFSFGLWKLYKIYVIRLLKVEYKFITRYLKNNVYWQSITQFLNTEL